MVSELTAQSDLERALWQALLSSIRAFARVLVLPNEDVLLVPKGEDEKVSFDVSPKQYAEYLRRLGFTESELRRISQTPQVVLDEVFEELGSRRGKTLNIQSGSFARN